MLFIRKAVPIDHQDEESLYDYDDEKTKLTIDGEPIKPKQTAVYQYLLLLLLSIVSYLSLSFIDTTSQPDTALPPHNQNKPTETIELQLPILYKNKVYAQTLLQHTFGNSWGVPAITTFTPPIDRTKFNRVVLTLNTTVDGVQYDRLGHIFINDIPVWRTSTAEPGNNVVFSSSNKDVSKYLTLFQQRESKVTFQLDNLVRGRLNGAFNTTLIAKYYYEEDKETKDEQNDLSGLFAITNKPASQVTQLINAKPLRSPLLYYPSDNAKFIIPKVNANTTNVKLALYVSGNAAEEFWYSNALDEHTSKFEDHGHTLLGHGPVRVINVYLDGVKVSTVAPDPVIFSGGISPALWRPIVGVNTFDIKPLEVDLTGFLPVLWKSNSELTVEIDNGSPTKIVGSNWIVSANVLQWESDKVESSFGEVEKFDNGSNFRSFSISTSDDNLFQTVVSNHSTILQSSLTYNLYNGTQVSLKFTSESRSKFANFQQYAGYGDVQFLSGIVASSSTLKFLHNEDVHELRSNKVYPLVVSIATDPVEGGTITYDANVTSVYGANLFLNKKEVLGINSRYNGTSTFSLSPNGNHGFGSSSENFVAELQHPFPGFKIDALAESVNGTLTKLDIDSNLEIEAVNLQEILKADNLDKLNEVKLHIEQLVDDGSLSEELAGYYLKQVIDQANAFEITQSSRKDQVEATKGETKARTNVGFGMKVLDFSV